jgi:hypothetical protein
MGDHPMVKIMAIILVWVIWAERFFRKLKNFQEAEKYFRLRPKIKVSPRVKCRV